MQPFSKNWEDSLIEEKTEVSGNVLVSSTSRSTNGWSCPFSVTFMLIFPS